MSREFDAFCIDHGIQRQHTVRNPLQQNGVAEQANRTMEKGIISMLYKSGMPPSFWDKALSSFIHVHNRLVTTAMTESAPYEAFLQSKPDLSMLHVWGYTAYVLIQKDKEASWESWIAHGGVHLHWVSSGIQEGLEVL
jgi:hypothetical protein